METFRTKIVVTNAATVRLPHILYTTATIIIPGFTIVIGPLLENPVWRWKIPT